MRDPLPRMNANARTPGLVLAALALLTALALGVRLRANDYCLPHQPEPDGVILWQAAWWDRPANRPEPTPFAYPATYYPYLLARTLTWLPGDSYPIAQPESASRYG